MTTPLYIPDLKMALGFLEDFQNKYDYSYVFAGSCQNQQDILNFTQQQYTGEATLSHERISLF